MDKGQRRDSLYDLIVGKGTNVNEGLGRLLTIIVAAIVALGTLFWLLG